MRIIAIASEEKKQFFYTNDHCQGCLGEDWVPVTYTLPMPCKPRPSLPSGMITNKKELETIFYSDMEEIRNPDLDFCPEAQKLVQEDFHLSGDQPSYKSLWDWK